MLDTVSLFPDGAAVFVLELSVEACVAADNTAVAALFIPFVPVLSNQLEKNMYID